MKRVLMNVIACTVLGAACTAGAQSLGDQLKDFAEGAQDSINGGASGNGSAQQLSEPEVVSGLKAALADGAATAVTQLGQTDGFWGDQARRIALPGWMNNAASLLRGAGYGDQMENLQLSMNRAAEQATAEAGPIVGNTINAMSVRDAYDILAGSDTAATQYLRKNAGDDLAAKFEPIIKDTTAQSQAVARYESLRSQAKPMLSFVPGLDLDLNDYVTQEALDGLFAAIGQQEAQIRANPAARGTDLLKKVFGSK